jgi:hypothetical protein
MMRRGAVTPLLAVAALVLVALATAAHAASSPAGISATVDRARVATALGDTFTFRSTIANRGPAADGVIAHLNIVSLKGDVYVDPEDWSTHRTRYLGSVGAGGSRTITWRLKAVSSGSFGVYVAVLRRNGADRPPITAPLVAVQVAGRTTLNAGGILSVALAVPACIGVFTLALGLRRRRA